MRGGPKQDALLVVRPIGMGYEVIPVYVKYLWTRDSRGVHSFQ
jgi:hypothetical protein